MVEHVDLTRGQQRDTVTITYPLHDGRAFDLTGETVAPSFATMLEVHHKQLYLPELNSVFPIRDPKNASNVHPRYADSNFPRKCDPRVSILSVTLPGSVHNTIWTSISRGERPSAANESQVRNQHRLSLEQACRAELETTRQGQEPPSARLVKVVKLEEGHCLPQEKAALVGQYGAVVPTGGAGGQVLGMFAGAKLERPEDYAAYREFLGPGIAERALSDFSAAPSHGRGATYAPYGGGNSCQYFNSFFTPRNDGTLRVDHARTNASFHPIAVKLKDKNGAEVTEKMLFCVQHYPLGLMEQVRLDYGPQYVLSEEGPPLSQAMVKSEDSAPTRVPPPTTGFLPAPRPTNDPGALAYEAETMAALDANMERAHALIGQNHGTIAHNDGAGMNCLIFALIQTARDDYGEHPRQWWAQMQQEANDLRRAARLPDGMLLPDTPGIERLVALIEARYNTTFRVEVAQPDVNGLLLGFHGLGSLQAPQARRRFILQGGNHFEAAWVPYSNYQQVTLQLQTPAAQPPPPAMQPQQQRLQAPPQAVRLQPPRRQQQPQVMQPQQAPATQPPTRIGRTRPAESPLPEERRPQRGRGPGRRRPFA